jgi:hypothetical protein
MGRQPLPDEGGGLENWATDAVTGIALCHPGYAKHTNGVFLSVLVAFHSRMRDGTNLTIR